MSLDYAIFLQADVLLETLVQAIWPASVERVSENKVRALDASGFLHIWIRKGISRGDFEFHDSVDFIPGTLVGITLEKEHRFEAKLALVELIEAVLGVTDFPVVLTQNWETARLKRARDGIVQLLGRDFWTDDMLSVFRISFKGPD